jgi:hypothetical protein
VGGVSRLRVPFALAFMLAGALFAGAAQGVTADDPSPPGPVSPAPVSWGGGYPEGGTPIDSGDVAELDLTEWRFYRPGPVTWEKARFKLCTTYSHGPFDVSLTESFGSSGGKMPFHLTHRFTRPLTSVAIGTSECRRIQFRWRVNAAMNGRGIHQLVARVRYPPAAPLLYAELFPDGYGLSAEAARSRG